jgi:hypothetical protein
MKIKKYVQITSNSHLCKTHFKPKNALSSHLLLCAMWHWNNCDNETKRTLEATLDIKRSKKSTESAPESGEPDKQEKHGSGAVSRVLGNANINLRILTKSKGSCKLFFQSSLTYLQIMRPQ